MPPQARLGDKSQASADIHGSLCCATGHPANGPAIMGSPNVLVNNMPAVRQTDMGVHAACCGPNMWTALLASVTVLINGLGAHRQGDMDMHCGGVGTMIEGSPNVIVGG